MTFEPGQTYYFIEYVGARKNTPMLYAWECLRVGKRDIFFKRLPTDENEYKTTIQNMEYKTFITKEEYEISQKFVRLLNSISNFRIQEIQVTLPVSRELLEELTNNFNALKQTLSKIK